MIDTSNIKKHNVHLVRELLRTRGKATKQEIAASVGLSVSTCNTILNEMEERSEVLSERIQPNNVGRSAKCYSLNKDFAYVIVLHFKVSEGQKVLYYAVLDLLNNTVTEKTETLAVIDASVVENRIAALIKIYPAVFHISLGIPGIVDGDTIHFCDIDELKETPLAALLRSRFSIPVHMENDMHLMAYGYYKKECTETATVTLAIFPRNILPGSGTVIDGKVVKGATRFAGQIGFLPFKMTHEEQKSLMTEDTFLPLAADGITALITILNPDIIILTGDLADEHLPDLLKKEIRQYVSEEHIPDLCYIQNIDTYYIEGLYSLAIESRKDTY